MTQKEFFTAVIASDVSAEVLNFAKAELEKLENKKPTAKAIENAAIRETIVALLLEQGAMFATEVAAKLEVTPQKANSLLAILFKDGKVMREAVKHPTGKGLIYCYHV